MSAATKAAELRNLSNRELATKLTEAKEELFNLRFQAATGQLESHGRLRTVRREIARVYTILREQELGITEPVVESDATSGTAADRQSDTASDSGAQTEGEGQA